MQTLIACFIITFITIVIIITSIQIFKLITFICNKYKQRKILKKLTYNKLFKHVDKKLYVVFLNTKQIGKLTYVEVKILNQLPFLQEKRVYELSEFISYFKEVNYNGET